MIVVAVVKERKEERSSKCSEERGRKKIDFGNAKRSSGNHKIVEIKKANKKNTMQYLC